MNFRRNMAGLLLLLLAIAGSAQAAPCRVHKSATAIVYVQLLQINEQYREEEQQPACYPSLHRRAVPLPALHSSPLAAAHTQASPRAPPTSRS